LRIDEGRPLVQLAGGEQPVELSRVVTPEAAPEDELLRRRDARYRVDLQPPEAPDTLEHGAYAAVERLRTNRDPTKGGDVGRARDARRRRDSRASPADRAGGREDLLLRRERRRALRGAPARRISRRDQGEQSVRRRDVFRGRPGSAGAAGCRRLPGPTAAAA